MEARKICPPVDLYLNFEKSSSMNWIFSLQKSISKLIFAGYTGSKSQVWNRVKIKFVELDLSKFIFQKSSTDQQGDSLVIWRTYYIVHTILHSKYGIHASSSFPHWIPDCWYKPFVRLLCDTSVQFGFAIIAHLLYHCAKDRRGVLALHSLSYTWDHNGVKPFLYSDTMRKNILNWCDLVSISKNVVFYVFGVVRIY